MDSNVTPPATTDAPISHMRTFAGDVAKLTGKPLPKKVENVPALLKKRDAPAPARIIPKAPTTHESKEAVLERLRAKVASPSVSAPPLSKEAPVGLPPLATKPASPLHTYHSDFAAHAKDRGATRISMVAAEADAPSAPTTLHVKEKRNLVPFVVGILLIASGLGAVYSAYRFVVGEPPLPEGLAVSSLIFADEYVRLTGSGEELRSALSSPQLSLQEGEVAVAYLSYASTTEKGVVEVRATGRELVDALRLPAPTLLLRSIEEKSTVGFIATGEETRPFFIFQVDSYERSFAGMLDWEASIENDLALFYPPYSTESATSSSPFRLSFIDEIIGNRDVRVLRDGEGRIIMLYGFRDKETLILARNTSAFLELLERLATTREQ